MIRKVVFINIRQRLCLFHSFVVKKTQHLTFLVSQTLLLSKGALLKFTTGHVIDLISNDVQRLEEETIIWLAFSISSFFLLVVLAVLLVYFIGWQSLMGVFFLCLLVPYIIGFSSKYAAQRVRTAAVTDRRISLMNQVISGIRAIKTRAWEDEYRKKIQHTRR